MMPLPFFQPLLSQPSTSRKKHPAWKCKATRLHAYFSSCWGGNVSRLRNVSAYPLNLPLLPPPIQMPDAPPPRPFHPEEKGRANASARQHSAGAVGHLKGEGWGKRVCERKRGGGYLHSKWHLMLVSPQCCLINHAGLNLTRSATVPHVWGWWAPVDGS